MADPTIDMTMPTDQIPSSGKGIGRVELPQGLLEKIRAQATTPGAPAAPATKAEPAPAKAEPAAPSAPAPAPAAKAEPAVPPKVEAAPAAPAEKPAKKEGPAQLREAYERAEAKVKELEVSFTATTKEKADAFAKLAQTEEKLKTYEERFKTEYEPQLKRLTEREKRAQELEEQLRVRDYTATPEFHERYVKPIADVQGEIVSVLGELHVLDAEGNARSATPDDFNKINAAPTLNAAEAIATELFGKGFATTQLMSLAARLRSLSKTQREAMKNAQLESQAWAQEQETQRVAAQAKFRNAVEQRVQSYLVKPAEGDPEEAAAFLEGTRMIEAVEKAAMAQDVEAYADLSARVKAAVASEKVRDLRISRLTAELAATRKELAAYQSTEPQVETTGGGAPDGNDDGQELGNPKLRSHLMSAARKAATGR
jgi:hypothetical protein